MRPRQQLIELFSTFLQFDADRFDRWVTDARLRRRMQQLEGMVEASPSEKFWALYWHSHWRETADHANRQTNPAQTNPAQTNPAQTNQSDLHLAAYLQEPCYWAAHQTVHKFNDPHYRLSDCFQIAIADVNTVLKGFNPERGASLKTYAGMAFSSLLRDALRQRQVVDLCTDWSLLRRVSKKRLLEVLHHAGLSERTLAEYRLGWVCFQALYVPTAPTGKLPKPDSAFWDAVAERYNAERQTQLFTAAAQTGKTLERWLSQTAQWLRSYLYPAVGSLNTPKFGEDTVEVQDSLTDPLSDSLLDDLMAEEAANDRTKQQTQLNQALTEALTKLDQQSQAILRLYYQQGMTQQQIMKEMAMSQASVSRRLSKARETLLAAIVRWGQSLNIVPTPTLIKDMSTALDEWLNARYQTNGAVPSI